MQASHYAIAAHRLVVLAEVNTVTQDRRDLLFKLSLAEIVEYGIRDSIWGTFAWFRKHLIIDIGPEADFIKIFVLNSHKDNGGKKDSLTDSTFTSTVYHDTSFQSASDLLLRNHFQLHILHFLPWLRRRPLQ